MSIGKIGILLPGAHGDIMSAMSVLKYKDDLWPNKDVVWFCSPPQSEVLKFAPVEIRIWEDFSQLIMNKYDRNHYLQIRNNFDSLKDLEKEYLPAPWFYDPQDKERNNIDYPNISKRIFGVDSKLEWHPLLHFSEQEQDMVRDFCLGLPYPKTIMLETDCRSGQSNWNDSMTRTTISMCRAKLGKCNFIFASNTDNSRFIDDVGVVSCSHFTIRQSALVNNFSDLFIGISSGISVATSCWGNKPTPKIQYTNTFICSTQSLSNGPFELIECYTPNAEQRYFHKLNEMLDRIK